MGTVNKVNAPKFAKHLPAGKGLDAVFLKSVRSQSRLSITAAPSHDLIVEHWGSLGQADRSVLVGVATDENTLRYMANNTDNSIDVGLGLIRNRKLPAECVTLLLDVLPLNAVVPSLYKHRTSKELAII